MDIDFDRDLDCHKCGQHKAPPISFINMTASVSASDTMENATLVDYYPNDWEVVYANGGNVSSHNLSYMKIEWFVGDVTDVSRWYTIKSPQRTMPSTKYYFQTEFGGEKSDWWMVIVADPDYEKNRIKIGYNPAKQHDYRHDKPSLKEIVPGHSVYVNDAEFEQIKKEYFETYERLGDVQ